jgi:hypothetical protein
VAVIFLGDVIALESFQLAQPVQPHIVQRRTTSAILLGGTR